MSLKDWEKIDPYLRENLGDFWWQKNEKWISARVYGQLTNGTTQYLFEIYKDKGFKLAKQKSRLTRSQALKFAKSYMKTH